MSIIRSFFSLENKEKKLIIKTLLLGYQIRLITWIYSFPKLQQKIQEMGKRDSGSVESDKLVWAVQATSPYVLGSTCLTNALTGQVLLSRNGYPSTLRIGVMNEAQFEAHAWLEMEGEVVLGVSEKEYVPLLDLKNCM